MAKVTSSQVGEYLKIGLYMAGAFIAYKAIKKLAETFGLTKTEEEQGLDTATEEAGGSATQSQENSNPLLAFNPNYSNALVTAWQKKFPNQTWNTAKQEAIPRTTYKAYALLILDAKGFFNDDEDRLYAVFRVIQTQYQLSLLSRVFSFYYKKDILEYLKSILNANKITPILKQVRNYPQYLK